MSSPKAPDPAATANAQAEHNREAAIAQQELNMVNQITPYGSLTYEQTGRSGSGTPQYTATQTLSPEQQELYDKYVSGQSQFGDIALNQLDNVEDTLSTPFDIDASTANELVDIQRTFLDPQFAQGQESLETQLYNQGVQPGTEAYRRAMEQFGDQKQRGYNQAYLDSYNTARESAVAERNQPLTEITSLLSGSQPQSPQFTSTPQASIAAADVTTPTYQSAQMNQDRHNAMMGGIFGLAAAPLGGWAQGYAGRA